MKAAMPWTRYVGDTLIVAITRGFLQLLRLLAAAVVLAVAAPCAAKPITISSPSGKVAATISDAGGVVSYTVWLDGAQVLAPSTVSVRSDGVILGRDAQFGKARTRTVNETYAFAGGKAKAVNRARFATIPLDTNGYHYSLDVHVADDGVGVRLRLPAKAGRKVEADLSTWRLPGDPAVWASPYDPGYEQPYKAATLSALGAEAYGLPLTAKVGGAYVTLSEAALVDYGDLAIKRQDGNRLAGFLPLDPKGWETGAEVVQPWRVTIVARDLTGLVNTTLVQNLNPPPTPALAKADWIAPGRSAWQWMAVGAPKYDDQQQWVDRTHALGFEYYLVDDGWAAWKDPWPSLTSVAAYARSKGVKIWLWVHSRDVVDPQARQAYFRRAAESGIVGVKVDFPEGANHQWSNWYRDVLRDAAAEHLLVDFHGAVKPTGMERTWPNELTREAVRGHEYHITRYHRRLEADHDVTLPFTRYVIGHGDYTPMVFDPKELQGDSWAHELAQAVVFTSPFLCFGGDPADYLDNPARDVISALPATWDETLVLPGSEPGKIAAFARRRGDAWFIGVLNGADPASLQIDLSFLGRGSWKMTRLADRPDKPDAFDRREEAVNAASSLPVRLSGRGGFVAWIRR
ncbi:glycoside hydrolase family 97 catalytic domain-containing protein [Caulobacter sp. LARHSG274]